jgi:hypothetical protein
MPKGIYPSNKGHKISEDTRQKMSIAQLGNKSNLGRHLSEKHKQHIKEANIRIGRKFPNWLGKHHSDETKRKMSLRVFTPQHRQQLSIAGVGRVCSEATKLKLRKAALKHGLTPLHKLIRQSAEYAKWRKGVFEHDDYRCFDCGARSEAGERVVLNADHIYPFALYPRLRFMPENGRTLCVPCHRATNTYGNHCKGRSIYTKK